MSYELKEDMQMSDFRTNHFPQLPRVRPEGKLYSERQVNTSILDSAFTFSNL